METIKFRIYDKKQKKIIESGATPMMLKSFFEYTAVLHTRDKMPYLQFTGLTDKNGKEIYEGDIISDGVSKSLIAKNLFHNNFGIVDLPLQEQCREFDVEYLKKCGVIGNIYENPNLLK